MTYKMNDEHLIHITKITTKTFKNIFISIINTKSTVCNFNKNEKDSKYIKFLLIQ